MTRYDNLPSIAEMTQNKVGDFNLAEYKCPKKDWKVLEKLSVRGQSEWVREKKISYIDIVRKEKRDIPGPDFYNVKETQTTRKSHVLSPLYTSPR